jgi:hypothetical protein
MIPKAARTLIWRGAAFARMAASGKSPQGDFVMELSQKPTISIGKISALVGHDSVTFPMLGRAVEYFAILHHILDLYVPFVHMLPIMA